MTHKVPEHPDRFGASWSRTAARGFTVAGVALAILAQTGELGLLGLSGWFIASCSIAGATVFSTFSYASPSGGVRAFALTRIFARYGQRVLLHRAALERLTQLRSAFFDRAAGTSARAFNAVRGGDLLDRALSDTQAQSEIGLRAFAPLTVLLVCGGSATILTAIFSPLSGVVLVAGCLAIVVVAWKRSVRALLEDHDRQKARAEVIASMEGWQELASLGAVEHVRARLSSLLRAEANTGRNFREGRAHTDFLLCGVGSVVTTCILVVTVASGTDPANVVLVVLLSLGVAALAIQSEDSFVALRASREAAHRSATLIPRPIGRPATRSSGAAPGSEFAAEIVQRTGTARLRLKDYTVPASVHGPAKIINIAAHSEETLVVRGRSGSGKTTLLETIAGVSDSAHSGLSWDAAVSPRLTYVPYDDYLFTGTVASNLRLGVPDAPLELLNRLLDDLGLGASNIRPQTRIGVGGRAISGGERRRILLARAIVADPDVLVMDEPTTGMDPATATMCWRVIRAWLPQVLLVVATHDPVAVGGAIVLCALGDQDGADDPASFALGLSREVGVAE